MGAGLALWHNAHRQRELAELLLQGPRTMAELADGLGVSVNDAEHILARLRGNGLPVAIVEDLDPEPRYRILCPKGRVCAAEGCETVPRRSNLSDRCELHGSGVMRLGETLGTSPAPRLAPHLLPRRSPFLDSKALPCAMLVSYGAERASSRRPGGAKPRLPPPPRERSPPSDGRRRRLPRGGARDRAYLRRCELAGVAREGRSVAA